MRWQTPKRCEPYRFGPEQREPARDKSVGLAFWAAFLCYFLFLQKKVKAMDSVLFLQKESRIKR
jgi:hypothetical protein